MKRKILVYLICLLIIIDVSGVCPNNCSGHGKCEKSVCVCYGSEESVLNGMNINEMYVGADCSIRHCFNGNPFGAVHSKLPSVSESSNGIYRRVLNEKNNISRVLDESIKSDNSVTLVDTSLDTEKKIWKVSGLEFYKDVLGVNGGILSCKYYKKNDNGNEELQDSPNSLNIISYAGKNTYAYFEGGVDSIDGKPASRSSDVEYTKVICDDIISTRNDFSQIITAKVTTGGGGGRLLSNNSTTRQLSGGTITITIVNYGAILKDLGLLTQETKGGGTSFKNSNFRLACYPSSSPPNPTTSTTVTVYNEVTATCSSDDCKTVTLTKEGLSEPSDCVLLMDGYGVVDIEEAEVYKNMRKEKKEEGKEEYEYKIGKYAKVESAGDTYSTYESDHVVIITNEITSSSTTVTPGTLANTEEAKYLNQGRGVYVTILENGIFSEELVEITETPGKLGSISGSVILPYVRTYPTDPLTKSPSTKFISQTAPPSSLYKAYYFHDDLLYSLKKEGGILECNYTTNPRERMLGTLKTVNIDVKGIVKNSKNNEIIYSYLEIPSSDDVTKLKTAECRIKTIRNDLTTYNPSQIPSTIRMRELSSATLTWTGYKDMITDLGFLENIKEGDGNKIACFTVGGVMQIQEYPVNVAITEESDPTFTITQRESLPTNGDWCFPLMRYDGSYISLENSDLKNNITKNGDNEYYYGDFIPSTDIKYMKKSDNREAIILSNDDKIEFGTPNKITLHNGIPKDFEEYFKSNREYKLKVIKKTVPFEELTITIQLGEIKTKVELEPPAVDITFTIESPTGFDGSNYAALLVLYISMGETPSPEPIPSIITLDSANNLYEISNFLEDIIMKLPIIGGSLRCNNMNGDKGVEIIDVKGVSKSVNDDDKNIKGYFLFEESINDGRLLFDLENINDCEIISIRKDMSLYNPLKVNESNFNNIDLMWKGYGTIFKGIDYDYKSEKIMYCYNPIDESDKKLNKYSIKMSNIVQRGDIYDLKLSFTKEKPKFGDVCYLLSDIYGKEINIKESELKDSIREKSGEYYFGKIGIEEVKNGKSVEKKKEDGSIEIIMTSEAIETSGDGVSSNFEKMNIKELNEENPSIGIPPSYIGFESEKMLYPGTTITMNFIVNGRNRGVQSSQIIRIEKEVDVNGKERFKIYLSKPISIPKDIQDLLQPSKTRLRSLATESPDILIELNWLSEGSTHISIECSGQGICDRESGLCKCFVGFSGSGCQRLDCPSNCNGNGRCVALSELLGNDELEEYKGYGNKHLGKYTYTPNPSPPSTTADKDIQFDNQVYGCLCDKRHRGYDCSLIECPSGEDPEGGSNMKEGEEYRDCSGRGICNYSSGICECFSGFSGEGCQDQIQTM